MKKEWFATWFDSPYYHVLYKERDEQEAREFMHQLNAILALPKGAAVLDLACGRGRHSLTLFQLGHRVTGADLSCESIREAQRTYPKDIEFIVHDMRNELPNRTFDAVFNLFTSFGYFDEQNENLQVLQAVHHMLNPEGLFVLDFMNADKVISSLVEEEHKKIEGIDFLIKRHFDGVHIYKEIGFEIDGELQQYTERVQALRSNDFQNLLNAAGFKILHTFGDFQLEPYDPILSDRLILIAQKNTWKSL